MQSSDMRILRRTILTTKHLLLNPKRFSPPSLISLRPLPNPRLSRYSHSASSSQEDSSNVKSWSRYGVMSGGNSDDDGQKQKNRSDFGGKVENERADDHDFHNLITTYPIGTEQSGIEAKEGNTVLGVKQGSGGGIEVKEANSFISTEQGGVGGGGGGITSRVGSKRKVKGKTNWVCSDCGYTSGQWWGLCRSCNASGTMKEFHEAKSSDGGKVSGFSVSENVVGSWLPQQASELRPLRLTEVSRGLNHKKWRITFSGPFGNEVSRVLGGGLVPGSLILVGGDPGVGKSTLLLQIAAMIAEGFDRRDATPVIYVSGEESVEQIVNRADRLGIKSELYLYSSTDIEDILEKIQNPTPRALIVDSIQTVYLKGVMGSAGGVAQVKECTSALLRYAKKTNTPVFLIGHVTKSGDIAGPRVLEHIVDVVLYMEGEKYSSHRMLRVVKNRFGSTDELGVLEMSQSGLQAVSNASEIFLSEQYLDSDYLAGIAVAVIMDGSRAFLIEIQALCVSGSTVQRHVNGVQASRADMIISVLIKQVGLHLQENAVFLNVVSGLTLPETAGDLAIAAAICSSFLEFPLPNDIAFIGEIGLGGELRSVPRMDKRINTVAKLGYRSCIVPKAAEKALGTEGFGKMKIVGCRNLKEVINTVFTKQ